MLAESRSGIVELPPADLDGAPDLLAALNGLAVGGDALTAYVPCCEFDLKRYQRHVQAHIRPIPMSLEEIPPLGEDGRIDRVWRFIAIIFLAHAGLLDVWQNGRAVMVRKREADAEGQGVPGDVEEPDGVEGLVGRVQV
jgi:hypothetical protein